MGSVRFPGKVMQAIGGVPMIGLLLQRLARAQRVDRIVVATSDAAADEPLARYVRSLGYDVFQGSETDVLDRYFQAATSANADIVVRITGDCPLVDPALVDAVIDALEGQGTDYASNIEPPTFPDGLDVEAVRMDALARAWREATAADDREPSGVALLKNQPRKAQSSSLAVGKLRHGRHAKSHRAAGIEQFGWVHEGIADDHELLVPIAVRDQLQA